MEKSRSFPSAGYTTRFDVGEESESKSKSYSFNGPRSAPIGDPEMKRRRRIASYNAFTVEAKLKSSVSSTFKWIKSKLSNNR